MGRPRTKRRKSKIVNRAGGAALAEARGGRTQKEMAEAIGVSQPTIAEWERGSKLPRSSRIAQVSAVYGLEIDKFVPGVRR